MWCVYVTVEPATGRFYVGKSSLSRVERGYQGSGDWVRAALKLGRVLVTEVLSIWESEADAYEAEFVVVSACRGFEASCKNLAAGGEGSLDPGEATRLKMVASHKARMENPESLAQIRAAAAKSLQLRTPEALARFSAAGSAARWAKLGARAAVSARSKASWSQPDYREKIAAGVRASWADPEGRARRTAWLNDPAKRAKQLAHLEQLNAARRAARG